MNRRARLKTRLSVAAFTVGVLCTALLVEQIGTASLRSSQAQLESLRAHWVPSTLPLHELRADLAELRASELAQVAHTGDQTAVAYYDARISEKLKGVRQALTRYQATQPSPDQRQLTDGIQQKLEAYLQLHAQISQAVHAGDGATADDLSTRLARPIRRALFADIVSLTNKVYAERPHGRLAQR